ncbi:sn-glycerol-3-phosphate ABC transporter ATP-binding protein UgpC [Actimicrobium sp. CCC2.4]|uniref:ABC transporter ATP-binding protein n=1 Tax=Actimicrobium sp. CCC2.4 TaxID=3048606 RepID=UPI002AC91D76|nr:sn-glycerol-3-phosphate ABC transporter ATP-binding protein UgpC [Actimicrobium sp. CCC2.4]MEB0137197.1 sn-glycerol-3-phosphate ABC transporter ATP-binding protein UgpC [Actimicrobium sp. CCC2.4]WPX32494.1 sn-glycerol-3-phosphate ABC transporter ATP-binding protein UgpC [Actimicrobium sp. CCC2.4]
MATLTLAGIRKSYGAVETLHGIDLSIADGEFIVFVGPSGCGKSTLLRAICGLEDISAGDLHIGERRVNDIAPAQRGIAMVFQSYALYPHMSVFENMAFGLKLAGHDKTAARDAVLRAAQILCIEPLLERKPKELSGGQRQRVAIGRAIVRKPDVFLFDEPLSNLDASLRVQMRIELANLHRELGATMIYVTHDQVEAMTLADRIVVLNAGRIEQVGAPLALYHQPDNLFVAGFMGSPRMNFFKGRVQASSPAGMTLAVGERALLESTSSRNLPVGAAVTIGARPEHITLGDNPDGIPTRIHAIEHLGDVSYLYVMVAGSDEPLVVRCAPEQDWQVDQHTAMTITPTRLHVFDTDGKACR